MKKTTVLSQVFSLTVLLFSISQAYAGDLEWSGIYRIEGVEIKNSELSNADRRLSYGLHHLSLSPKIEAADGLTIRATFDILNDTQYPAANFGQFFGSGPHKAYTTPPPAAPTNADQSNVLSQSQPRDTIEVRNLYLTVVQEHGALIAGRAPLQFGLGLTHNAGTGLFDHWSDTRDLVGYKIVMGNFFLFPMYGKVYEGGLKNSDDVNDLILQLQFENPETDTEMGVIHQIRTAKSGTDSVVGTGPGEVLGGGTLPALGNRFSLETTNIYFRKSSDSYDFGFEGSYNTGDYGVRTTAGGRVRAVGYAVAGEFEWHPAATKTVMGSKLGIISGDDPTTDDKFEGYFADRNYDVAFMLFNHPLGQADFFRTKLMGGGPSGTTPDGLTPGEVNSPDTEALSNAMYLAPYINYKWKDRWQLSGTLAMGWLVEDPLVGKSGKKDLGYEIDLALKFVPNQKIMWVNQLGILFPGAAFEGDGLFGSDTAIGFETKAAISF